MNDPLLERDEWKLVKTIPIDQCGEAFGACSGGSGLDHASARIGRTMTLAVMALPIPLALSIDAQAGVASMAMLWAGRRHPEWLAAVTQLVQDLPAADREKFEMLATRIVTMLPVRVEQEIPEVGSSLL